MAVLLLQSTYTYPYTTLPTFLPVVLIIVIIVVAVGSGRIQNTFIYGVPFTVT